MFAWTVTRLVRAAVDCVRAKEKILSEKRFGKFAAEMPCPRCKGSGTCPTCGGTGAIEAGGESRQRDTKKSTNSA
jgi:DnaJ-class molecular chaperone